jgi:hypothetical protein
MARARLGRRRRCRRRGSTAQPEVRRAGLLIDDGEPALVGRLRGWSCAGSLSSDRAAAGAPAAPAGEVGPQQRVEHDAHRPPAAGTCSSGFSRPTRDRRGVPGRRRNHRRSPGGLITSGPQSLPPRGSGSSAPDARRSLPGLR